ncbi:fused MFS/spermidine synthase [Planctomycetota bacterium]
MQWIILIFAFFSGAAALIYEIAWVKILSLIFGNTTYAVSLILASFMLGLGLGGVIIGRLLDRIKWQALRCYAILELCIAGSCLAFPLGVKWAEQLFVETARAAGDGAVGGAVLRVVLIFLLVVLPTFFMGGTFPALCKAVIRKVGGVGSGVGLLYGLNTAGAVAGTVCSGFWLMEQFGVAGSTNVAVAINAGIGITAFFIRIPGDNEESLKPVGKTPPHKLSQTVSWVAAVLLFTGFTNIAYQVLWTRMLSFFLRNHIYAFTSVLGIFLVGLAAGSLLGSLAARWERMRLMILGIVIFLTGSLGLVSLGGHMGFGNLYEVMVALQEYFTQTERVGFALGLLGLCAYIMLLPTILMGMVFPLVSAMYVKSLDRLGSGVGWLYQVNTVGTVLGSLLTGFVFIPLLKMQPSMVLMACVNIVLGSILLLGSRRHHLVTRLAVLALCLGVSLAVVDLSGLEEPMIKKSRIFKDKNWGPLRTLISYEEDVCSSVSVVATKSAGFRTIYTDNFAAALTHEGTKYMRMLGHIPMLLHKNPEQVLVVCLGTGTTAGSVGTYKPTAMDVVEISPAVADAARKYFTDVNKGVLEEPFCHVYINDGRNFILTRNKQYDVISLEPLLPHTPAAIDFYTYDFYQICRERMAPGGVMCQWIPVHAMTLENFRIVLKSFVAAFPWSSLWFFDQSSLVIGAEQPVKVDFDRLRARLAGPPGDNLQEVRLRNPYAIMMSCVASGASLKEFCRDFKVMTDEHPWIEFHEINPPKSKAEYEIAVMRDFKEMKKGMNIFDLLELKSPAGAEEVNRWQAYQQSAILCYSGRTWLLKQEWGRAMEKFQRALDFTPADPVARSLYEKAAGRYHLAVGCAAIRNNNYLGAQHHLKQVVQLLPADAEGHYYYGIALLASSRRFEEKGESELQKAIELNPEHWRAYLNLSLHYYGRQQFEDAAGHLNKALELRPDLLKFYSQELKQLIREAYQSLKAKGTSLYPLE